MSGWWGHCDGYRHLVYALHGNVCIPLTRTSQISLAQRGAVVSTKRIGRMLALIIVRRQRMGLVRALIGSILIGGDIVVLHYSAMASMRFQGMEHYCRLW